MPFASQRSRIPGVHPPEVLIFFRIPKAAGTTMDGVFEHCFPDRHFHGYVGHTDSALLLRPVARVAEKFRQMTPEQQRTVRCLVGVHVGMEVANLFDRPSKFFTIVRDPVDRAISSFFYFRVSEHLPSHKFIKDMTLEQYMDSGIGLDSHNMQVRLLSGCAELDAPWDPYGRPISTPPVERRHLELAKRNIEEHFLVAAPMEAFAALVWYFKRLYDWPLHQVLYNIRNETIGRPKIDAVSAATRSRLRAWNAYDIELYEWVKARFARQIAPLEPAFSREVRRFAMLNRCVQQMGRISPVPLRNAARTMLFGQQPDISSDLPGSSGTAR